jgi:hypothetical protein
MPVIWVLLSVHSFNSPANPNNLAVATGMRSPALGGLVISCIAAMVES